MLELQDPHCNWKLIGNESLRLLHFYIGFTQLRRRCKDNMPDLLREALPSEWEGKDMVKWYPDDKRYNHPTKNWLKRVWDYLREQFERDLCNFKNLPLIPLDLSCHPKELTKMATPSKIVANRPGEKHDILESSLCHVLKALGVIIIKKLSTFSENQSWNRQICSPTICRTYFAGDVVFF